MSNPSKYTIKCNLKTYMIFVITIVYITNGYARKELPPFEESTENARTWFLNTKNSLSGWNFEEKLGVAEYLYLTLDSRFEDYESIKNRMSNILHSMVNMQKDYSSTSSQNKNNLIRFNLLQILIHDCHNKEFIDLANNLVQLDPQNGLFRMFQAEYEFSQGEFLNYMKLCYEAINCTNFSFREKHNKRNITSALRKSGYLDKNMMYYIMLNPEYHQNFIIVMKHVTLLSFFQVMENTFGGYKLPNIMSPERQYLSKLFNDYSSLNDATTYVLYHNILDSIHKKIKNDKNISSLITKEYSLLQIIRESIIARRHAIEKFLKEESENEIEKYLLSQSNRLDKELNKIAKDINRPDTIIWENLWKRYKDIALIEKITNTETTSPATSPRPRGLR